VLVSREIVQRFRAQEGLPSSDETEERRSKAERKKRLERDYAPVLFGKKGMEEGLINPTCEVDDKVDPGRRTDLIEPGRGMKVIHVMRGAARSKKRARRGCSCYLDEGGTLQK